MSQVSHVTSCDDCVKSYDCHVVSCDRHVVSCDHVKATFTRRRRT